MKDIGLDLRVIRTKEAIKKAVIELIEEKGFEATTVKDITTRANINRGTFYSHYEDKYDLMAKCEEELVKELESKVINNIPKMIANLDENHLETLPFTVLVPFFEFMNQNRGLMKVLLGPKADPSFQAKLKGLMLEVLFKRNKASVFKQENLLVPKEYLVSYIASAHIGVIQEWLKHDCEESPQEIARIIATMTINGPFFAAGLRK